MFIFSIKKLSILFPHIKKINILSLYKSFNNNNENFKQENINKITT